MISTKKSKPVKPIKPKSLNISASDPAWDLALKKFKPSAPSVLLVLESFKRPGSILLKVTSKEVVISRLGHVLTMDEHGRCTWT